MNILNVFGNNLRQLAEKRGTYTASASALGLSKVQFQRYLNGTSFPKPHLLKSICEYYDVDARILTEPLNDALLRSMQSWDTQGGRRAPRDKEEAVAAEGMMEAMTHACPVRDYFGEREKMPDGFYLETRRAMSRADKYCQSLFYVKSLTRGRIFRNYDDKSQGENIPAYLREFRGVVLSNTDGVTIVSFCSRPSRLVLFKYYTLFVSGGAEVEYLGFSALGRAESPGTRRLARVHTRYLGKGLSAPLAWSRLQRERVFIGRSEVPSDILEHLDEPL